MKVMTILGTRPEIIKLAPTLVELDKYTDHVLVHTGQNYDYELNEVFFRELGLRKPDYFLNVSASTLGETIGNVIAKADQVMEQEKPDAVLLYGDTNSCLSIIAAKRRKIPIFHMEAGNRCFDERVPEEINRKIVDHLADINMVLTEQARNYLQREGLPPERTIKVGSSMLEVFNIHREQIESSDILKKLNLEPRKYFVVSSHREEVVDTPAHLEQLLQSLNGLVETYGFPVVVSTHPRTRKRLESLPNVEVNSLVTFVKPFGFFDYIALQKNSFCTLSDSGTITEESSLLHFPAVTLRNAHERPEGNDEGTLIMCGYEKERVLNAVNIVTSQFFENCNVVHTIKDYETDNVSRKVVRIITSYTPYINEYVWRKNSL